MAKYKIEASASGSYIYFHVYKALGPWPFYNWSWSPVYTTESELDAEEWIKKTKFSESPEGLALAKAKDIEKRKNRANLLAARDEIVSEGGYYDYTRALYVNSRGDIKYEP